MGFIGLRLPKDSLRYRALLQAESHRTPTRPVSSVTPAEPSGLEGRPETKVLARLHLVGQRPAEARRGTQHSDREPAAHPPQHTEFGTGCDLRLGRG